MNSVIANRLQSLREIMRQEGLSAFIFPSSDAHGSEYTPEHWHGREWVSGFDGSAGTAVVTMDSAALWTDSRYFLAADECLKDTEFELMKDGLTDTPTISKWLGRKLALVNGAEVGIDGYCISQNESEELKTKLRHEGGITLRTNLDILDRIWHDRPAIPVGKIFIHSTEYCGTSCKEKLQLIRKELKEKHACGILMSALDEIAWTLNLRGSDVHCTPVFVAYLLLDEDKTILYINREKLTNEVISYLKKEGVQTDEYVNIEKGLKKYGGYNIMLDPDCISSTIYNKVHCHEILIGKSPALQLKAVKNTTEIDCIRNAMEKDGVALVRLMRWLKPAVNAGGETEISVDRKLTEFKKLEDKFFDLSFDTIAGYKEHGAIVHYEATPETDAKLKPEGLLLLDCGSQFLDGTTDITRTFALGTPTEEEKRVCTLVMKGHIRLAKAKFVEGTCGTQLDILARGAIWEGGYHYRHGTGHGVGFFLSCHEGPHQARMEYRGADLKPGMIMSDEPGVYLAGKFGCRIENLVLVVPAEKGYDGEDFYKFETLTLCPYDTDILNLEMLTDDEKEWIDCYHKMVYDRLSPRLKPNESNWLKEACKPINRTI